MHRIRAFRSVLPWVCAAVILLAAPGRAAVDHSISGIARDASGQVLAGVEVLVLKDAGGETLLTAVSGPAGVFRLGTLAPGLYRIVALKPGYLATLTRVNTFLRTSLDLVLRPLPTPGPAGEGTVPDDLSWALRVPRRSILKDVDPSSLLASASAPNDRPGRFEIPSYLVGGIEQRVSMTAGASAPASRAAYPGSETRMRLSSTLGERGQIEVRGSRESEGATLGDGPRSGLVARDHSAVSVDVRYDTEPDSRLAVKAYFSARNLRSDDAAQDAPVATVGESQRAWGYDASWTKQVDAASRVAVRLGYLEAMLDVPAGFVPQRPVSDVPRVGLENRTVDATGSYETVLAEGHQLQVDARMRLLDLAAPQVRSAGDASAGYLQGAPGWNLAIRARDEWTPSAGWTIAYGLAAHEVLGTVGNATLVVPRAGASWSTGALTLRGAVSYYQPFGAGVAYGLAAEDPAVPTDPRFGYDAEAELLLGAGVRFRASHAYVPRITDPVSATGPEWAPEVAIFATDGNARDSRTTLGVERQSARAALFAQWTEGAAVGTLAETVLGEWPLALLADRRIEYRSTRIGARVVPTGTEVAAVYQRIEDSPLGALSAGAPPTMQEFAELQFGQVLVRFRRPGAACRFVMAARAPVHPAGAASGDVEQERTRVLTALNRRVSAGLALAF